MNVCEAVSAYANHLDWICYSLYFLLGTWKMWELGGAIGRWIDKKFLPQP